MDFSLESGCREFAWFLNMNMINNENLPSQYDQITDLLHSTRAYLVGGAVRDLLLNRSVHDLDFALPENTIPAAKQVADQLGGSFFVLDQERQTCRVILRDEEDQRLVVDFTLFRGNTIEEDLSSRDFTITSMALDIQGDIQVIDPFQGAQDLKDGLIRLTSESALEDDSLRCLRAVRLAAQLDFRILPETRDQIRRSQPGLEDVSPERIRDEFFRLLDGPNQSAGILSLQMLGLYPYILPGELSPGRPRVLRNLETLWSLFLLDHDQERAANWSRGLLVHRLGRYREIVRGYLDQELVPGRSIYQLTFLISLLGDLQLGEIPESAQHIAQQVPLSNQEAYFVAKGIKATGNWRNLTQGHGIAQPVEVYRFFNRFGQAGVAAIFLGLGEALDNQQEEESRQSWIESLDKARYFLEGYWEHHLEWVDPPVLLDGYDIQQEFHIAPGPRIGSLLELLREEQVRSGLKSREEGLEFLKNQLSLSDGRDL
ncbi:MAG: hypothetical protein DRI46_02100 [Chloroflexi bacterium]|nr:MAG: hypothetical protein DRI46_02100 [Chloroflexota bacterium]